MTGNAASIEKLEGIRNYNDWEFLMRMCLIHDGLWNCVTGAEVDEGKDQRTLAKICLNVAKDVLVHVRHATKASEAWENLEKAYEDKAHKLSDVKKPIDDELVAAVMLSGLTPDYGPLIMALQTMNVELSNDMVKAKLLQTDLRELISAEEAVLIMRQKDKERKSHSSTIRTSDLTCYNCKEPGHFKVSCPKLKKKRKPRSYDSKKNNADKERRCLLTTAYSTRQYSTKDWYVDSCSSSHMSMKDDWLEHVKLENSEVILANRQTIKSTKKGDVNITLKSNKKCTIKGALHVPHLSANLLSVSKMIEKGLIMVLDNKDCKAYDKYCSIRGRVKFTGTKVDGIYRLDQRESLNSSEMMMMSVVSIHRLWHRRLGHLSVRGMKDLRNGLATGLTFSEPANIACCVQCLEGKEHRESFNKSGPFQRAREKLELIHSDVYGLVSQTGLKGEKYLLNFVDDYTRKCFGYLIKTKDEVPSRFAESMSAVERETGKKIKTLRTDNGREYVNQELKRLLASKAGGIANVSGRMYQAGHRTRGERFRTI